MHTETRVSGELLFDGRIFRAEKDEVVLEDGRHSFREVARHKTGAACVLCETDGQIVFVRQFRYAYGTELLELPAGKIDPGETPSECAARELREETGLVAEELVDLGECCPSPGWMVEHLHLYAAVGVRQADARLDPGEFLDVLRIPAEEAFAMVLRNEIPDAKTQIALLKWQSIRNERSK